MKISDIKGYLPTEANYRARHKLKPDTVQLRLKDYEEIERQNKSGLIGSIQDYQRGDLGSQLIHDKIHFSNHPESAPTLQDLKHIYEILLETPKSKREKTYTRIAKKLGYTYLENGRGDRFWIRPSCKKEFRKTMGHQTTGQELRRLKYEAKHGPENSGCYNFMTLFRMKRPTSPQD